MNLLTPILSAGPALPLVCDDDYDVDEDFDFGSDPIRMPHPLECRSPRPRRRPVWTPSRRSVGPLRDQERRSRLEGWHDATLAAAPDLGHRRINFTYRNWVTTTAGYSEKARRAQYHEGPVEPAAWIMGETLTTWTDVQFQPLTMTWRRAGGGFRRYDLDVGLETEAGELVFAECKASQEFLDEPETRDLLDEAERELASHGARLDRLLGTELLDPIRYRVLKDVFDDRRTEYDPERDLAAVLAVVERGGGTTPLARALEALGGDVRLGEAKLNAMMVARAIRIDVSRPPMPDTPVDVPPPAAAPGRLRAFLRRFADAA